MSLPRYAHSVDTNQETIVSELRSIPGVSVEIIGRPVDLAVGFHDRTYLVEIKRSGRKGRRTKGQIRFFASWTGGYIVATTTDEILEFMGIYVPRKKKT